jgi:hypothetical protein
MFNPSDQGASDDVGIGELCIFHQYKELFWPLFGDLLHVIFVGHLVIGLQLLLTFIPACNDVNKVLIRAKVF